MKKLVLGPMAVPSDGTDIIAAGPWCFAAEEDFFPYWEEHFEIAPEPFTDRELQKRAIGEAFALATDMIPPLAHHLAPKVALPDVYWETLLAPYCINVAKILVELTYRVRAMVDTYGAREIEVALLPDNCSFDMGCDQDVVLHGCLNPVCLHWLCSLLLRPMLPGAWHVMEADAVREDYPLHKPESFGERMRENLRNLALSLPCPPLRGMPMARAMRYSLALLHKSMGEDHSRSLRDHYSSKATGAHIDLPLDPMPIFLALLPKSIRSLKHPKHAPGPKHKTRVAHILMYEDAHYRQKLALWRARGGRLACVQHGGNYGMMRHICAMELVEYTQHAFITWGWKHQESAVEGKCGKANFLPLPPAQLANVSNCWRGGSNNLILVGTEMPTVGYQLDCHPTPMQNLQYREDKQWFVESLGHKIQSQTLYRPYFPVPGTLDDAPWLLSRFPRLRLCTGPLMPQLLHCRLLVLDHHGTTMLEAMAANIPTICYWDPTCWPIDDDFHAMLLKLGEAGIWHSSAEDAAVHVVRVWDDPLGWWRDKKTQAAREAFMDAYAWVAPRHRDALWTGTLRRL